jgi:hypothetical protein
MVENSRHKYTLIFYHAKDGYCFWLTNFVGLTNTIFPMPIAVHFPLTGDKASDMMLY